MNIEDRLRSHLHSGDELFAESGTDAGMISAVGRRRTRRNQIGGAAAGGVLAFGLVFGLSSLGREGPEEFVSESLSETAEIAEDSEIMADDVVTESQALPEAGTDELAQDAMLAEDFFEHEIIVGVGDGFAGLRATEDGIVALRSNDGIEFSTSPTTGIPENAEITTIVHRDGVFAAPFAVFDDRLGQNESYIGTSNDLVEWTVVAVDLGPDFSDVFLGEVALLDGEVVAVVVASPPFDEDAVTVADPSIFTLSGPVGGPYAADLLEAGGFGASQLRAAGDVVLFVVSTDSGADLWARSGGAWMMVREFSFEDFPTLTARGTDVYLISGSTVERSSDGGRTWSVLSVSPAVDARTSTAAAVASDDRIAVLFGLTDEVGANVGHVLAVNAADALSEISLDGFVEDRAFVHLVAVSADEALLEVFPEPDAFDEDLAASGGLVEDAQASSESEPRYVRVPIG